MIPKTFCLTDICNESTCILEYGASIGFLHRNCLNTIKESSTNQISLQKDYLIELFMTINFLIYETSKAWRLNGKAVKKDLQGYS